MSRFYVHALKAISILTDDNLMDNFRINFKKQITLDHTFWLFNVLNSINIVEWNMRMNFIIRLPLTLVVSTDRPADNIILIKIVDNEDGQETDGLRIMCQVDPRDKPFPPIETYEIAVNDVIESASNSPSLILESIPRECVEISCTGINDIGRTNTTKTYCPRSDGKTIKRSMIS